MSSLHTVDVRESYVQFYNLEVAWSLAALETCLYGAYFVMFAFYLHLLRTRRMVKHSFLAIATMALFILSAIHCALLLAATILGTRLELSPEFEGPHRRAFTTVTLAAEAVLTKRRYLIVLQIFRCYAIWNFKVVIFPMFLTLTVAGLGYFTVIDAAVRSDFFKTFLFDLSIAISLLTTFVLMALTVVASGPSRGQLGK
ncbi:hypothetical protein B0H19DRAFT_1275816 [Mycena capillaripes]|nr:hypothetical protein B0H19DRAFT_1275816 [Mycena capillaripes]